MPEGALQIMTDQSAPVKDDQTVKRQRLEVPTVSILGAHMHLYHGAMLLTHEVVDIV